MSTLPQIASGFGSPSTPLAAPASPLAPNVAETQMPFISPSPVPNARVSSPLTDNENDGESTAVMGPAELASIQTAERTNTRRRIDSDAAATPVHLSVLHLVNGEHFAGAERVQSHLGRCLPALGIQADFACVKPRRFADAVDQAGNWGHAYRTPMRHRFDLTVVNSLRRIIKSGGHAGQGYDLLHAHTPRTAMIAALASRITGVPWVYHVHSPAARDSSHRFNNRVNDVMERLSLRNCSHLITVSSSLSRELLAKGWPVDQVTVVHNGVPAIRYVRSHYPVIGGRWVFGMVALMRPRKGLEIAIDAIALLRRQGFDAALRCIGPFESDDYRRKIESQISMLGLDGCIEQSGFKSDVPATLSQLDAMLLPSLYGEGLPMVVLEAMASALPVIATRVEGTPEAIRHGADGLLAEPGSAASLADQMRRLMTGDADWSTLAESAFRRHASQFSDRAMAANLAAVYEKVTAKVTAR